MRNPSRLMGSCAGLFFLTTLNGTPVPQQDHVQANGITIAYQSFGSPDRETDTIV